MTQEIMKLVDAECTWTKDPDFEMGDTWDSSCGEKWSFIDGGPAQNRVRYCHGCGGEVAIAAQTSRNVTSAEDQILRSAALRAGKLISKRGAA